MPKRTGFLAVKPNLSQIGNVFFALAGLASMAFGGVMTYKTHFEHPKLSYIPTDDTWRQHLDSVVAAAQASGTTASPSSVVVEVSGAVQKPGVFSLHEGARVQDAILQADGFLDDAHQEFVHRELGLAQKLFDQQKIYIPFAQESESVGLENEASRAAQDPQNGAAAGPGKKSLNQATQKDLEAISGIGAKRAEQILSGMPYSNWNDFKERADLPTNIHAAVQEYYTL